MMKKLLYCLAAAVFMPTVFADVYTWTDKTGKEHYGDVPPADAIGIEKVEVPLPPTKEAVDSAAKVKDATIREAKKIEAAEKETAAKQAGEDAIQARKRAADEQALDNENKARKREADKAMQSFKNRPQIWH